MKNFFKSLVVGALLLGSVGCSDMFKEDLYEINNEIDKINQRIDSLCNAVNTNIASLQTIIDVMQDNDYVDSIVPIVEGGETVGYEITFTQSGSVKIYHGKKGETGATGHTPIVGVKQAEDGRWYWTVDGEYLLDAEGDKILAEAIDGEDGATGADGITPQLKVEGDYWYISYDNKATWERLGKATGEAGKDGDSMFQSVNYNDEYVELVLVDGTVLRIPTWASHMLLVDEIAKINSNISAIQAAIEALESNDYVQKVTPVKDSEGNVVGYTLQFAYAGDVTIYHGEDGKDGEDGEDGKDGEDGEDGKDGYTPVIGARQHPDGNWYWTVDTEWLLDTNGNKVKTTGEDGTSGITPELKIEDDYWYVSYDKGQTWTKLGKAKGEDGAAGSAGTAGDAFFKGVDTSDEYYVKFTLADGTVIKIPTWKAYQELADLVDQLNTNFKSLNDIVVGIQNNDYITGYTPIVDPQTNEEIGYTLHFKKSGDITIYHGKTGQDGVAPDISIQEHPKYGLCWTYNGEFIIDPGTGKPVALPSDGKNGKDGVSPKLKIEDGEWWVSYNNGTSWTNLGQATGDTGATGGSGDSFFKSIVPEYATDANGNVLKDELGRPIVAYIVMTLAGENEGDEIVYKVPTEYVTDDLNKRLAAIETQFSAISTIVNSLMNAEYIKDVVELYEGPALVGYEIVFVKYTIGADGKLTETTRKSTIRNGGAGAAGTVVDAEYDEATDTWYWTLDGKPLVDEDGNYVAINGKDGKPGATPQMRINTETNFWEVSYDGGKTWVSTEVLATGPQGPQGNPGQGGAAGDSFFSNVYKSEDGLYWVFDRTEGEDIMVPTAEAFASLAGRVAALEETSKSIMNLVSGKKYIESCEPFDNETGTGYHLVLVSVDPQTGETVKEDCYIYDGKDGVTPVVGLRQDEATGDWYWTVDGEDILVDGKPVKANGPQGIDGPVPSFRIDPTNGHLYVTINGTETDLGRVVGANGSAGESGTNSSINVNTAEDGKVTITFIGGDGKTSTIEVPSWAAFVELQDAVSALNTNVETISALVYGHKYVESFKELENGGYEFVVRYYDEAAKEWKTEAHTIDVTTADEIGVKQDTDGNYYWTKGGEWLLDAAGNKVMVDGSAERTLEFKSENDGKLYYKYSDETEWTVLDIAVSESVVDSNVVVKEEDGKVTVTVLDDAGLVLYTFSAPSWEAFEALQGRVIALEEQVTEIYDLIDQLTTNYEALSGDVNSIKNKLAKCKFIGEYEYDAEKKGYVIYFVDIDGNKLTDASGAYETVFIADGKDGVDGEDFDASQLGFKEVDGEYFWTYNGEMLLDAEGNPVKAHGADGIDGKTPEFRIFNDVLQYKYEGEDDDKWQSLGNVKGSAAAANITVENPANPNQSMWIMIQYTYTDAQGNEIIEEVKLPTYYAYEQALEEIAAIKSTMEMIEAFLKDNKFVSDYELTYDNNGMITGCTVTTVEYKLQEDGSYRVFKSKAEFNPSQTMSVKLENDVWYLVFYNEDGDEVKRPLSQSTFTFVPKVAVNNGYIYVAKVSEPGNDYTDTTKWDCLGAVVELLGGETQGALKSVEEVDGYICFTFSNGEVLKVPSEEKFQEVLDRLDAVEERVEDLETVVAVHASSIEGLSALSGNVTQLMQDVATLKTYKFIGTPVETENGWEIPVINGAGEATGETITLNHGADGTDVTIVQPEGSDDYYWFVNGENTGHKVTGNNGKDGKTPIFRINAETGKLEYQFEGDEDWIELEKVVGEDGAPGAPGTNGATNVVFASVVNEDGTFTELESEDASQANWVGIIFVEGDNADSHDDDQIIWMPTYKNFLELAGRVTAVEGKVTALEATVALHETSINSLVTLSTNVNGLIEDVAKLKTYKFIGTPEETENGWKIPVVNGAGEATGETITLTNGKDGANGSVVTIVKDDEDGKYYWAIDGVKTEYAVTGNDGQPAPKPEFQINATSGQLEYRFEGEGDDAWKAIGDVVGEDGAPGAPGAPGTPGTNGATNVVFASEVNEDGTFTEVEDASQANWVGIIFVEGENAESYEDDQIIWVPTYKNFQGLQALVTTLNTNVTSLSGLINGKRFITAIKENWSGEVNGVQRTGVEITYVEISDNKASDPKTMYIYNGLAGVDGANGATVGVKKWTVAEGGDDKLYWTITLNGAEPTWLLDENGNKVLAVGTDGTPGTDGKTPEFKIENDVLYWKYKEDVDGTWNELCNVKGDPGDPGKDALSNVVDNGTYYTITYSDGTVANVAKWVEAGNVTITFSPSGTLDLGTAASSTVTCTIQGSFGSTTPAIYTTCEGHFTSTVTSSSGSNGSYSYVIEVKATTAYVNDDMVGKLTVYCPYYGSTVIGQLQLKANAKASLGVTSKNWDDEKVTISVGIDEDLNTANGGRLNIEAMTDEGGPVSWLHMGDAPTKTGRVIKQELTLDKYILTAEEAYTVSPRSCTIAIYSPSGREVGRQQIVQYPIVNLAQLNKNKFETANCYIISAPGRYMIPARKGNSTTEKLNPSSPSLGFPTNDGANTVNFVEMLTYGGENYIVFDVNRTGISNGVPTFTNAVANGNTVIALKDGSTTLWSWHLWFNQPTSRPDDMSINNNYHTYANSTKPVMNRALGAINYDGNSTAIDLIADYLGYDFHLWTDGLYYQYGRKDPLTGTNVDQGTGSYDASVQNPSVLYKEWTASGAGWTADKSVNDPCPPGYKVPSTSIWSPQTSQGLEELIAKSEEMGYPYNLETDVSDISVNVVYPYLNYYVAGDKVKPKSTKYDPAVSERSLGSFKVQIIHSGFTNETYGTTWAHNGYLYYNKLFNTTEGGKADIYVYYKKWYPRDPDINNPNGWTVGQLKDGLLSQITGWAQTALKIAFAVADPDELAQEMLDALRTVSLNRSINSSIPASNASHVRCVKE